jgi:general nucleoside transport system ATP-binding protein
MAETGDEIAVDAGQVKVTSPADPSMAIELTGISKFFGPVRANDNIDLAVRSATIHGIVGENGAGKSTLMSILYGFYEADRGSIHVGGKLTKIKSSDDAIAAGIGMVHQHFMLIDTFTVLENIILGAESGQLLQRGFDHARKKLEHLEKEYGLFVDLDAITSELPVGEQQRIEILKALYRDAKILILDEPTGVLTPQEADQLFRILEVLKREGVTIVLITHKLREIMAITDSVSVMRNGKMVAHRETKNTSREELAELMVGRKVTRVAGNHEVSTGDVLLKVEGVSVGKNQAVPILDNLNFDVRAGEIVGIAGVSGNGQSELLEILSGIRGFDSGSIVLNGREVTPDNAINPKEVRTLRAAHVPEDRHRLGLVTNFTAEESVILGYQDSDHYNHGLLLDRSRINQECQRLMDAFDVRPRIPEIRSANMSGGNQQKLILAREFDKGPEVLLVGQPTRGVDIGAIEFIHGQLLEHRNRGCAILLVSVELDEIMTLSDRILVMFEGRIVAETDSREVDEKMLGLMMANAHEEKSATLSVSP